MHPIKVRSLWLSKLAHAYDKNTRCFIINDVKIPFIVQDISCILGVRNEGSEVNLKKDTHVNIDLYRLYKDPKSNKLTLSGLASSISENKIVNDHFVRKISLLIIGVVLAPGPNDNLDSAYINLVEDISSIKTKNWAKFALEETIISILQFQSLKRHMFYHQSILLMVLFHFTLANKKKK